MSWQQKNKTPGFCEISFSSVDVIPLNQAWHNMEATLPEQPSLTLNFVCCLVPVKYTTPDEVQIKTREETLLIKYLHKPTTYSCMYTECSVCEALETCIHLIARGENINA